MPTMELSAGPPARLVVGKSTPSPMVVTLLPSSTGEVKDLNGAWAYVSLMSADRKVCLAPPREDLLRGKRADSIHPVKKDKGRGIGFAEFSDLAVLQPGKYCFRINLMGTSGVNGLTLHTGVFEVAHA